MKKILAIMLAAGVTVAHAEAVMKKVCHTTNGKQVCKTIKTHKKVEGTKVPDAPVKKSKK
jgi:type II secretory pathway component PulF